MKKAIFLVALGLISLSTYAQNHYPPTGNVGIGILSPSEVLEIYKSTTEPGVLSLRSLRNDAQHVDVGRITAKQGLTEVSRIGMPRAGGNSTGYLTFWTKADNSLALTEKMRLTADGKLGLGQLYPSSWLHVQAPAVSGSESLLQLESSDAAGDYLRVENATGSTGQFIPVVKGHHQTDDRQALYLTGSIGTGNDNGTQPIMAFDSRLINGPSANRPLFGWYSYGNRKMTMLANGNLGVGIDNPSEQLEIYKSTTEPGVLSLRSSRNDAQDVEVGRLSAKQGDMEVARIGLPRAGGTYTGYLTFWTKESNSAALTETMRLTESGKLGIGISTPSEQLEVYKSTTEPGVISLRSDRNDAQHVEVGRLSAKQGDMEVARIGLPRAGGTYTGYLTFWTKNDNAQALTEKMRLTQDGKLGLGQLYPSSSLHVQTPAISGGEKLLQLETSDAPGDYLRVQNATGSTGQLIPNITGHHQTDDRMALYLTGSIGTGNDNGSTPITAFDSRISNGPVATRPLFAWYSYGTQYMTMLANGSLGIGTTTTGTHKLAVEGTIGARKVKVEASGWSDFVFDQDYKLRSLKEVESFISENKHLPDVPSEAEVTKEGIDLGDMDATLLQKIEELTLYLIEQNKKIEAQQKQIEALQKQVKK